MEIIGVVDSIGALPEPAGCLALEGLTRPSDPTRAAHVDAVYAELDACEVAESLGRFQEFETCAARVLEAAREAGDQDLLLDARRVQASATTGAGDSRGATALYEALYFDALAAGRSRLAADVALSVANGHARVGGDPEEAGAWLRHAEPLRDTPSGDARLTRLEALAAFFARKPERAIERARRAVELSSQPATQHLLGGALNTLGRILNESGFRPEARGVYERAVEAETQRHGKTHPRVATALNNLATVLGDMGELDEALTMFQRALAIRRAMLPRTHRHVATGTANVAETLARLGRHAEAVPYFAESAEIFAAVDGADSWYLAMVQTQLGSALLSLDRFEESRRSLDVALRILRHRPTEDHDRFEAEVELALLEAATGNTAAALEFFESALAAPLGQADRATAQKHLAELSAP